MHMKNLYIASAAIALLFAAASCDRTDPFIGGNSFVTFSCDGTLSVSEDAGTLSIPVRVIGEHGDFTATVSSVDGTALSNTHYKMVEPASGVLNFAASDSLKYVVIELTHLAGYIEPGKWNFTVNIDNATGGIERGSRRSVAVNILDADHPLKHFIGTWVGTAEDYFYGPTAFAIVVEPDANDITKLNFYDLCPSLATANAHGPTVGVCSEDLMTMTLAAEQPIGYEGVSMTGFDGTLCDIIITANPEEDSITIQTDYWGCHVDGYEPTSGWYSLYMGPATFTRQK